MTPALPPLLRPHCGTQAVPRVRPVAEVVATVAHNNREGGGSMTERRLSPEVWILPEVVIVRTCADCGIVTRSTEPVPVLPPAYELEWLCEECYRTWKH
jgi:hypothetical protein